MAPSLIMNGTDGSKGDIPPAIATTLNAADQIRLRLEAFGLLVTHEHPQVRIMAEAVKEAASDLHAATAALEDEIQRFLPGGGGNGA